MKTTLLKLDELEQILQNLSQDVIRVRTKMSILKMAGNAQLLSKMRDATEQLEREADKTRALHDGLDQIITLYVRVEHKNRDNLGSKKNSIQEETQLGGNGAFDDRPTTGNAFSDILAGMVGPAGIIPSVINSLFTTRDSVGALKKVVNAVHTLIGQVCHDVSGSNTAWGNSVAGEVGSVGKVIRAFTDTAKWTSALMMNAADNIFDNVRSWASLLGDNGKHFYNSYLSGSSFMESALGDVMVKIVGKASAVVKNGVASIKMGAAVSISVAGSTIAIDCGLDAVNQWATHGSSVRWSQTSKQTRVSVLGTNLKNLFGGKWVDGLGF